MAVVLGQVEVTTKEEPGALFTQCVLSLNWTNIYAFRKAIFGAKIPYSGQTMRFEKPLPGGWAIATAYVKSSKLSITLVVKNLGGASISKTIHMPLSYSKQIFSWQGL